MSVATTTRPATPEELAEELAAEHDGHGAVIERLHAEHDALRAQHDRRVAELLAANNAEVARRRAAEAAAARLQAERDRLSTGTLLETIEGILDRHSAWIVRPSREMMMAIALAAGIAGMRANEHAASAHERSLEGEVERLRASVEVTDEMVEAGRLAGIKAIWTAPGEDNAQTAISRAIIEGALAAEPAARPTHRHRKRGTIYVELARAELQSGLPALEGDTLVVYRGQDGRIWCRPDSEFDDEARFERLAAAPLSKPEERLAATPVERGP